MIGKKIKELIERSGFSAEQVAVEAEMSVSNLQKIYKRDSIETRYLIKICRKLGVPYNALLGLEDWLGDEEATDSINNQRILIEGYWGKGKSRALMQLRHQLELCQLENSSLEQLLKAKEDLIEVLREKQE